MCLPASYPEASTQTHPTQMGLFACLLSAPKINLICPVSARICSDPLHCRPSIEYARVSIQEVRTPASPNPLSTYGYRDASAVQGGCRHHCASDSSEHRPLAHTLSANHHAVGTYLTYYSTKLCVVTFLVPCVFGLCHVSYALMGSFVCLISAVGL